MKRLSTKEDILQILKGEMPYLKSKYGVERIAIFGSFAKGNQNSKSDIDILVQLTKPIGLDFMELADYLEEILGRKVDLSTFNQMMRSKENSRYQHIALDVERTMIYA
ncbi:MAG: nucleotidyltransferase family protein [Candidatus Poribacteria bacterium]